MRSGFHPFFGFMSLLFLLLSFLGEANNNNNNAAADKVYIVYMGGVSRINGAPRSDHHAQLLSFLNKRKKNSISTTYSKSFFGFAARLSEEEARLMAQKPQVVSVFPDPILRLHTTRSWDFLKYQSALKINSSPNCTSTTGAHDTIIGVLDTGISPESESFADAGMSPIPPRWKGVCMTGENSTSFMCNRKVIGARYYYTSDTPRDDSGHGTHVSSTAAGRQVLGASYYDLAKGTAQGGSPCSRIAMYRVCTADGECPGSAILKAFDDAIADGVDVLSISLGLPSSSMEDSDFATEPIAIGAFHAVERGIIVVCSAGNNGPLPLTVVNIAPWILTVAATTIDRDYEVDIVLGGNKVVKGGSINFSGLNKSPVYPLVDGGSANSSSDQLTSASNCVPGSLDYAKVKGKIVLCKNKDEDIDEEEKFINLKRQHAVGMILIDSDLRQVPFMYGTAALAIVSEKDGAQILSYINSTNSTSIPLATILPTVTRLKYEPAPVIPFFSSRGPINGSKNLLKPDIAAPGVAILAAWPSNDKREALRNKTPPRFNILSGTSMACPHVSGLAATVRSHHPKWSPSAIRSAIMTTATQTNNLHGPIMTHSGLTATPYDMGAGQIHISGPLHPGLVYETETIDYITFLCNMGYNASMIKIIALDVPHNFSCPRHSNSDLVSNMNYPSIAITRLKQNMSKTVKRTVTNVGEQESTYTATVEAPASLQVQVVPNELQFTKNLAKLSFEVTFKATKASPENLFGSITWSNDKHKVRSPFAVSNF